jgi:hypothetical protein
MARESLRRMLERKVREVEMYEADLEEMYNNVPV